MSKQDPLVIHTKDGEAFTFGVSRTLCQAVCVEVPGADDVVDATPVAGSLTVTAAPFTSWTAAGVDVEFALNDDRVVVLRLNMLAAILLAKDILQQMDEFAEKKPSLKLARGSIPVAGFANLGGGGE